MPELPNRFGERYDAVLHLLDRQVIDSDGLMVCKVDDLELSPTEDGLTLTAVLAGPPALLPRLGGRLGRAVRTFWVRMGDQQADRRLPYRIDFDLVEELTSALTLRRPRHGVLVRIPGEDDEGPVRHRLGELLQFPVDAPEGRRRMLDVRVDEQHRIRSVVIGHGRPGALLGYDGRDGRPSAQGPALVRWIVRALHRHAREVPWDRVHVDWDRREVRVAVKP